MSDRILFFSSDRKFASRWRFADFCTFCRFLFPASVSRMLNRMQLLMFVLDCCQPILLGLSTKTLHKSFLVKNYRWCQDSKTPPENPPLWGQQWSLQLDCFRVIWSLRLYDSSKSLSGGLLSPCECFSVQKPENTNTDGKVCQLTRVPPHSNSRNLVVPESLNSGPVGCLRTSRWLPTHVRTATWLILPVVICLSQRLSHACLSTSLTKVKPRMAH